MQTPGPSSALELLPRYKELTGQNEENRRDNSERGRTKAMAARGARRASARLRPQPAADARMDAAPERQRRLALLRTRIMREMRERHWVKLAIVPVTVGAGATTIALDLAAMIARHDLTQVMLIDLDLAAPAVAKGIGIAGSPRYSQTISEGRDIATLIHRAATTPNLAVLAAAEPEPAAAEVLQGVRLTDALTRLAEVEPAHIVVMDCAPLLGSDVGLSALPLADAILLIADGQATTDADMKECERLLTDMPPLMGIILNKSES